MSTVPTLLISFLLIDAIKSQLSDEDTLLTTDEDNSTSTPCPDELLPDPPHPNIVFILTDDWGINDVGWTHDNTDTLTPYLDNLARTEGLILSNYYTERVCTATRASFLTGRYPSHLGLQAGVCAMNQPAALTRQVSMLSNEFQASGYSTHLIGKWHLGMISHEYTPTYRGFDTFFGFWAGGEDYYSHQSWSFTRTVMSGDLFINENPALYQWGGAYYPAYDGVYGLWWQKTEALKLLQLKALYPDETTPFFFYFAMQASHSPHHAPQEYISLYVDSDGDNTARIAFQAQTTSADDAIKEVIEYMKQSGLWDNTLVIIGSDNGAKYEYGDNAPYRGFKNTSWEGGVKVPAFVTGGYLEEKQRGKVMSYPMHIVDWYKTLLSAAGLNIEYERSRKLREIEENFDEVLMVFKEDTMWDDTIELELDGIDMWEYIAEGEEDDEYFMNDREILLDLKDVWCEFESCGAIRIGQYKYIRGNNVASLLPDIEDGDQWFRDYAKDESVSEAFCNEKRVRFKHTHDITKFEINSLECVNTESGCLFDLELDPCEYYDLSAVYPDIAERLQERLNEFQESATVALMGENNVEELFGREVIEPPKVCSNIYYWCPFKQYSDIEFEYKLYRESESEIEENDVQMEDSSHRGLHWKNILYIGVALCVVAVIFAGLYYCWRNQKHKESEGISNDDIMDDISEVQPLKYDEIIINYESAATK